MILVLSHFEARILIKYLLVYIMSAHYKAQLIQLFVSRLCTHACYYPTKELPPCNQEPHAPKHLHATLDP
jgi:hypothetical protein